MISWRRSPLRLIKLQAERTFRVMVSFKASLEARRTPMRYCLLNPWTRTIGFNGMVSLPEVVCCLYQTRVWPVSFLMMS